MITLELVKLHLRVAERYATRDEQRQRAHRENDKALEKALDGLTDPKKRKAAIDKHARNARRIDESYADKRGRRGKSKTEKAKFTVNKTVLSQAAQFDYAGLEKRYGLPKNLLAALSMQESRGNATVQTFEKMGDALAEFVATGKLDFRSLTVSILQDLSKMMIKMALFNAMKAAGESMSKSGGTWGAVGSAIVSAFGKKDGGIVQRFSNGGAVWGAGTATSDSIPAMLSNGEFVINAASTRRHRALLEPRSNERENEITEIEWIKPVKPAISFGKIPTAWVSDVLLPSRLVFSAAAIM